MRGELVIAAAFGLAALGVFGLIFGPKAQKLMKNALDRIDRRLPVSSAPSRSADEQDAPANNR